MDSPEVVLIATPQADLATRLQAAIQRAGYKVECATTELGFQAHLEEDQAWALIMDAKWMSESTEGICSKITKTAKGLHGGIIAIYDPEVGMDFSGACDGGVVRFVALPAQTELILAQLRGLDSRFVAGASSDHSGFVSMDIFQRNLERGIAEARNKDRNLAVMCMSFGDSQGVSWAGMEMSKRAEVERWLIQNVGQALETRSGQAPVLGVSAQDLRLTWIRPDRVGMLIPGLVRVQDVAKMGAGMQEAFQRAAMQTIGQYVSNVAFGVALCPGDSTSAGGVMEGAQKAAERARTEGNTSLSFCTESMGSWAFERLTLEESLHNALINGEFRIHYQPRVDAQTKEILGAEALVRWVHPQLGMVSPAQFIPLAEETGLIVPIGEWVLRQACIQNQAWREAGYKPIRVSVNLSPVQFRDACLTDLVDSALAESGLTTDGLELEVTESMLMNDPDATVEVLKELKTRGLKISIDDFGTGYSSLSYLKQFPIDSLKVDRSFIRDVTTNSDDAAITTAVILMGHSLKLNVVAEGVETESQLAFLQVLQCNEIQGYLFSPPVPPERFEQMLSKVAAEVSEG